MLNNLKSRIIRAIIKGQSVNQFAGKMQANKGAMRSLIFKQWFKVVKLLKNNLLTVRACSIAGCFKIVSNTAISKSGQVLKAGSIHSKKTIDIFASIYSFGVVIL